MEFITLDRNLRKLHEIEEFESAIWTERYFGDSNFEMTVPATPKLTQQLFPGTFITLTGTSEVMVVDTLDVEDERMKVNGKSLLQWFNNRFIRASPSHKAQTWFIRRHPAGETLWIMIREMATSKSKHLTGMGSANGIPTIYLERLIIPELGLHSFDKSGGNVDIAVPYGPLYDAMREVATTHNVGMQIVLEKPGAENLLGFRSYKGFDRTSKQKVYPTVRFSPFYDSLANVKELQSNSVEKNLILAFDPNLEHPPGKAGIAFMPGKFSGFDLRAAELFTDSGDGTEHVLNVLDSRAKAALAENSFVRAIDGDILHTHQFQYGRDFNLGDVVEIQGNNENIYPGRIVEFIRSQDSSGEKGYPLYQSPFGLTSPSGEKGFPTVKLGEDLPINKPQIHPPLPILRSPDVIPYSIAGVLTVANGNLRWYAGVEGTIESIHVAVGTVPSGSGLTVRVNRNGTSLGTVTIPAGNNTNSFTPVPAVYEVDDYFTVDVTVASGSDLVVQLRLAG